MKARVVGRRRFLGGTAAVVGLPLLESLGHRRFVRAATCDPPRRLLVYHVPNGVYFKSWLPAGTGPAYAPTETLARVQPIAKDVLVLSGLANPRAVPAAGEVGGHAYGAAGLLTCAHADKRGLSAGTSFDQLAAQALAACTRLPSLELGMDTVEGGAEGDVPVLFNRNISWSAPKTPVPRVTSPQIAFDRLFAGFDPNATAAANLKRKADRSSVLDVVRGDGARLAARLNADDRMKLDEYLGSIRQLETRIAGTDVNRLSAAGGGARRPVDAGDFPARLDQMHAIMNLAFRSDATRVISFSMGNALSTRGYPFLNVNGRPVGDGHFCTHHSGNPDLIAQSVAIDKWRLDKLVELVTLLKTKDAGGAEVLGSTGLYYTSEIGDGNSHAQDNKAILLIGQMGGAIATGRMLVAPDRTPLANLYLALLQALGVNQGAFGDGTKPLALV
jgi:hypothetical protein